MTQLRQRSSVRQLPNMGEIKEALMRAETVEEFDNALKKGMKLMSKTSDTEKKLEILKLMQTAISRYAEKLQ